MSRQSEPDHEQGERIKALEVQMEDIMGNGQPGRMKTLETRVEGHTKLIWVGMGVLFTMQFLSANGLLTLSKIFGKP